MLRQEFSSELGKYHFMVTEGIDLGHKIYAAQLEVDQAKVSMIETLMPPITVKGIKIFWTCRILHKIYIRLLKNFKTIMHTAGEGCQI